MRLCTRSVAVGLLLSTTLCLNSTAGKAQTDSMARASESQLAIALSVQPLFVLSNALKLDLEIQKPTSRFGYVVSPELYGGQTTDTSVPESQRNNKFPDRISGFGLGVQQKLKFKKQLISPYFAYGLTYRRLKITYDTEDFVRYEENGLSYYAYGPVENPIQINSLLFNGLIGVQTLDWDFLLLDLYVGFGYKIVDVNMSNPGERRYNKMFFSPAFKGPIMMAGIKLGVQIKK
jgi:hypothetical protein